MDIDDNVATDFRPRTKTGKLLDEAARLARSFVEAVQSGAPCEATALAWEAALLAARAAAERVEEPDAPALRAICWVLAEGLRWEAARTPSSERRAVLALHDWVVGHPPEAKEVRERVDVETRDGDQLLRLHVPSRSVLKPDDGIEVVKGRRFEHARDCHVEPVRPRSKAGRNEPCPCGSGLKVKRCCGEGTSATRPAPPP